MTKERARHRSEATVCLVSLIDMMCPRGLWQEVEALMQLMSFTVCDLA